MVEGTATKRAARWRLQLFDISIVSDGLQGPVAAKGGKARNPLSNKQTLIVIPHRGTVTGTTSQNHLTRL